MFEEKLIAAVQKNPCIYDKSLKAYRNKLLKEKAWLDVSANIGVDVEQCQCRWRSLRDRFLKELHKKPKSGRALVEEREWVFYPAMSFLKGHVAPRRTVSNCQWQSKEEVRSPTQLTCSTFFEEFQEEPDVSNNIEQWAEGVNDALSASGHIVEATPDISQASIETPSTYASARKRKVAEEASERFNCLLRTAQNFLAMQQAKGRNDDFYKVLDSFLLKLPENTQDELKSMFLKHVFDAIDKNK